MDDMNPTPKNQVKLLKKHLYFELVNIIHQHLGNQNNPKLEEKMVNDIFNITKELIFSEQKINEVNTNEYENGL